MQSVAQVLSLTADLQAAVLKNLGPGCLSDARLVCSQLRGLVDQQLVTGLELQVPGREVLRWRDIDLGPQDLEDASLRRLCLEQQDKLWLQAAAEHWQMLEKLEQEKNAEEGPEQEGQQLADEDEDAPNKSMTQIMTQTVSRQLESIVATEKAVVQLTSAFCRFPALRRLSLGARWGRLYSGGGGSFCAQLLDGAALSSLLAAVPPGRLGSLTLCRCRLNDMVLAQLGGLLLGTDCDLSLELDPRNGEDRVDGHGKGDGEGYPLSLQQLTLLGSSAVVVSHLQGLSLEEGFHYFDGRRISKLGPALTALTALTTLTLPGRHIDSETRQLLQGLTRLTVLRVGNWYVNDDRGVTEEVALPASLRCLELLDGIELVRWAPAWPGPSRPCVYLLAAGASAIQRLLPAHATLKACLAMLSDMGSLSLQDKEEWRGALDVGVRVWAGLLQQGRHLELCVSVEHAGTDALEALAPLACSIHTAKLMTAYPKPDDPLRQRLGAAMSEALARTLPSLRELFVCGCHVDEGALGPLSQLRQLRLLHIYDLKVGEHEVGPLAAGVAALLLDSEGSVAGEGRLQLEVGYNLLWAQAFPGEADHWERWEHSFVRDVAVAGRAAGKAVRTTQFRYPLSAHHGSYHSRHSATRGVYALISALMRVTLFTAPSDGALGVDVPADT